MQKLAQGAEAVIYEEGDNVVKDRFSKSYRHEQIDAALRKFRTKREANQSLAKDPEHNVLLLSRMFKQIYLVNYKTSGTYGTKVIPMPDPVVSCVMRFLRVSKNNKYLISNFKGSTLSTTEYSKFLISNFEKHLGKKIGSSTLRKVYLSGKYGGVLQSMVQDADNMCHSLNTQKIYIKNI